MALERAIALTAFAVGLAVVVLWLAGCGEDDERVPVACSTGDSLPAVGAKLAADGRSIQFAYAGAEPCMFGGELHKGTLHVELRTDTEFEEVDRRPPVLRGCATGVLEKAVPPGTPVEIVYGNRRLVPEEEIRALLAADSDCLALAEGEEGFIID